LSRGRSGNGIHEFFTIHEGTPHALLHEAPLSLDDRREICRTKAVHEIELVILISAPVGASTIPRRTPIARSFALEFFFIKFNIILFHMDDGLAQKRVCLTYEPRTYLCRRVRRTGSQPSQSTSERCRRSVPNVPHPCGSSVLFASLNQIMLSS
jgi:hypothetical protein